MIRALCPTCTKVVAVAGPTSAIAGRLVRHRTPAGAALGMCAAGGVHKARKRDLIHPCARCAELPALADVEFNEFGTPAGPWRPDIPRPTSGSRPPLCSSHRREHTAALKTSAADRRRQDRYGITAQEFAELKDAQGGGCACGLLHEHSDRGLATDHDHAREAECVRLGRHPAGQACKFCVRGAAGTQCNAVVLGRFTPTQLENLAAYMRHPTAERLGWWRTRRTPFTDDSTTDDRSDRP